MENTEKIKYAQELKRCVLLHSNDIHADFFGTEKDNKLIGGIARLSGYIKKVREEIPEQQFMYTISGDMFRGSIIDSEFSGLSTARIINALKPDVVCIGNHEIDYGITHSLMLEKIADFPIINCNLYVKYFDKHLYNPYYIKNINGGQILFIGVITENMSSQLLMDKTVGPYIEVKNPVDEINTILSQFDISQFTSVILLSHIGLENDIELAKQLDPEKVHAIIGGHSHTLMDKPLIVNDIPIVQAGTGTGQIGRLDIWYHPEDKTVDHAQWQTIYIDSDLCPIDEEMDSIVQKMRRDVDDIYSEKVFSFCEKAVHTARNIPTPLPCFLADCIADVFHLDLVLINPGLVRSWGIGPVVTRRDFKEAFPYKSELIKIETDIRTLKQMLSHYYSRDADWRLISTSVIVPSKALNCVYSEEEGRITELTFYDEPVPDDLHISLGLVDYLVKNAEYYFGGDLKTLTGSGLIPLSSDIMAELEIALKGKENIALNSVRRFNRIFADHSELCQQEDLNAASGGEGELDMSY